MTNNSATLDKELRRNFSPALKSLGFKASGRNYRKQHHDLLFLVNVQGSQWGGQFTVNLAAQPIFIPNFFGQSVNVNTIKEYECEFGCRLSDAPNTDKWWIHKGQQAEMELCSKNAADIFIAHSNSFFDLFTGAQSWFQTLSIDDLIRTGPTLPGRMCSSEIRLSFVFAQTRLAQGRGAEAKQFAEWALSKAGQDFVGFQRLSEIANTA